MPCQPLPLSLDMLKDKGLQGQCIGWEFGFLSDFLNRLSLQDFHRSPYKVAATIARRYSYGLAGFTTSNSKCSSLPRQMFER